MKGIYDTTSVQKIVGAQLQKARKKTGLSRSELCNRLNESQQKPVEIRCKNGLSEERLKQWEYGNNPIGLEWIPAICAVLGVDYGYLFGEYDENTRVIADVSKETGLTGDAVKVLIQFHHREHVRAYTDLLSCIISDPDFEYFLGLLEGYFSSDKEISAGLSMSNFKCRQKDLSLFASSVSLQNIMNRVGPVFLSQYKTTEQRLDEYFEKVKKPMLERRKNSG